MRASLCMQRMQREEVYNSTRGFESSSSPRGIFNRTHPSRSHKKYVIIGTWAWTLARNSEREREIERDREREREREGRGVETGTGILFTSERERERERERESFSLKIETENLLQGNSFCTEDLSAAARCGREQDCNFCRV